MKLTSRQADISDLLRQKTFITVDELANKFEVTGQTIRRDINQLCDLGLARRRHGGIVPISTTGNLAYDSRQALNRIGKVQVAEGVAKLIPNSSSISLGIGTTPEIVMNALLQHDSLRIFTNSLNIAQIASVNPNFEINICGGRVRNADHDLIGSNAQEFFGSYKTDFGIFGVAGVDLDGGLLDFYEEEVRIRDLIRTNCRESILVLDHLKFGRAAHVRGGEIQDISKIFCDKRPPEDVCDLLEKSGSELIICENEEVRNGEQQTDELVIHD